MNHELLLDLGSADLRDVNLDAMTRLKMLLAPKMATMKAERAFDVCIVGLRPLNDIIHLSRKGLVTSDKDCRPRPCYCRT